jgi:predicted Zn-dependent protease
MRQLIVANPDKKDVRRALVAFLLERNRPQDAETEMRALVAAHPADTAAALDLVEFTAAQKGADAARHELARLIEAHPDTMDYQLAMARLDFSAPAPRPPSTG